MQVSFDEFMAKLDTFEEQLAKQQPISALHETVQVQRQENEALQKDLSLQDPVFEKLVQNGQGIVDALEDAPEREAMEKKITELKTRWQDVKDKVGDRQKQLSKVEKEALKFRQEADSLSLLLGDAEKQVDEFEPLTVDIESIAKQKELVQQIKGMVDRLKSDVRDVGGSADELKEDAQRDEPVVEAEVEDFVARIEKLSASSDQRVEQLSAIEAASHDYHVTVKKVEDVFSEAFDIVDAPVVCAADTESASQQLAKIKVYLQAFRLLSVSVIRCYVAVFGALLSVSLQIVATGLEHTYVLCYSQEVQISSLVYSRILRSCKQEANVEMYQAYMYHLFKSIYVKKKSLVFLQNLFDSKTRGMFAKICPFCFSLNRLNLGSRDSFGIKLLSCA